MPHSVPSSPITSDTQQACPTCRTAVDIAAALERVAARLAALESLYEGIAEGLSGLADALDMEPVVDGS